MEDTGRDLRHGAEVRDRSITQPIVSDAALALDPRAFPIELIIQQGQEIAILRERVKTALIAKISRSFDRYFSAPPQVRLGINDVLIRQFGIAFSEKLTKKQAVIVIYYTFIRRIASELRQRILTEDNVVNQLIEILGERALDFSSLREVGMVGAIFTGAVEDEEELIRKQMHKTRAEIPCE